MLFQRELQRNYTAAAAFSYCLGMEIIKLSGDKKKRYSCRLQPAVERFPEPTKKTFPSVRNFLINNCGSVSFSEKKSKLGM